MESCKKNINSLLTLEEKNLEEIIVVDDCSHEQNSFQYKNDKVRVIRNFKNLGYASTVNQELKIASSDIILFLDSDAHLINPVIEKLIALFNVDALLGSIGLTQCYQAKATIFGS